MKRFWILLLIAALSLSAVGCNKNEENSTILNIAQNDYAGAYQRLTILQENVLEKMQILEEHNYEVMSGNPTDYWSEDNFYFVNFLPVYNEQLVFTAVLNEIDDFAAIQSYIKSQLEASGYNASVILRREANHYKLKYGGNFTNIVTWKTESGYLEFDCIYDPANNRMKVTSTTTFNNHMIYDFYEFAELSEGKYAVQNSKERLYVEYNENGEITAFYYSVLPEAESISISSNMDSAEYQTLRNNYGFDGYVYKVNTRDNLYVTYFSNGDTIYFSYDEATNRYHQTTEVDTEGLKKASATGVYESAIDSIYLDIKSVDLEWVFEAGNFEQTIIYKDNIISVMNTNILTKEVEEFAVREVAEIPVEETTVTTESESTTHHLSK